MKEKLQKQIDDFKSVMDTLPVNTIQNRNKKKNYIETEKNNQNKVLENIKNEINMRKKHLESFQENSNIHKLQEDLKKCNIMQEWNKYNTPYEKMHLDYYLYQLHRYYKEDLKSVNTCIMTIISSFSKVGINIVPDDFAYNKYVKDYITLIMTTKDNEKINSFFEDVYWKYPEIISTTEVNLKSIFLRNEKKIAKYYEDRHNEFLASHSENELNELYINLNESIEKLSSKDPHTILEKFKNHELSIGDYSESLMTKKKEQYFPDNDCNINSISRLKQTIFEYNMILKYEYLLEDMKTRLGQRETYKGIKAGILKDIANDEKKLKGLNNKQNGKGLFFKPKKNDEKTLFAYRDTIKELVTKYDELEKASFNETIYETLNEESTVLDVFKCISANYLYYVDLTKGKDENITITDLTNQFDELKELVYRNEFTFLNHLALLDEKNMQLVIADKYQLDQINLTMDNLKKENMETTTKDVDDLYVYESINESMISVDDIKFYLNVQKLEESEQEPQEAVTK